MTRKAERIAAVAEKAGIRASLKEGHLLTEEELRRLKIQTLPGPLRLLFGILGIIATGLSADCFVWDCTAEGIAFGIIALLLILFAVFGVRKTLGQILDSMSAQDSGELLGLVMEGIITAVGSLFDGI